MDWSRRIDGYCERVGPEFWAEPVNAVSNGAFIIAGIVALVFALKRGRLDAPVAVLTGLLFIIGIGSFLFHTYATVWAAMTDTGPIALFILCYFAIAMNRYAGLSWWRAGIASLLFIVAMGLVSWGLRITIAPLIGGSYAYVPALLALLGVGLALGHRGHPAGRWLMIIACLFAVSLTFRALDLPWCGHIPGGTHFMWHLLNACVLGGLLVTLICYGRSAEIAAPPNGRN